MRKLFPVAVILVFGMVAFYFSACNSNKTEPEPVSTNTDSLDNLVKRGDYLANHVAVCIDCHSKRDITKFSLPVIPGTEGGGAGFPFGKEEGIPGVIFPPNITPFSLSDWTDDQIATAITHGVNKKGDTLFPIMPYHNYSRMAKDDIYSIIAYLRTLKSIDSTKPPRKLDIPSMSVMGPLPAADLDKNKRPDPSDKVKYGEYLVTVASCSFCHTPMTPQGPDMNKLFAGGFVFKTPFFKVAVANITPDSATGIGTLTEDAFIEKFKGNAAPEKVNADPGKKNSIMPWSMYGTMKEGDLRAIYAFLRTVKPVTNKVVKYPK